MYKSYFFFFFLRFLAPSDEEEDDELLDESEESELDDEEEEEEGLSLFSVVLDSLAFLRRKKVVAIILIESPDFNLTFQRNPRMI